MFDEQPVSIRTMSAAIQRALPGKARKSPVKNHVLSLGKYDPGLVFQSVGEALNQTEEAITTWPNMGTMLDKVR